LGARVIGTVGTEEKAALARENGCHHAIVYTKTDFVAGVREITNGAGVPVVYDSVGRATFAGSLDCLSPRGMLVSFGNASGKPDPFDTSILAQKGSLYLTRPALFAYTSTREDLLACAHALFDVVRVGVVKIDIRQRYPLADAVEAHLGLEARKTTGSTVLLP
jgi:NADPH2:quinone reductase